VEAGTGQRRILAEVSPPSNETLWYLFVIFTRGRTKRWLDSVTDARVAIQYSSPSPYSKSDETWSNKEAFLNRRLRRTPCAIMYSTSVVP
jgi:hypothetical protein